jgi:hypothetical protein
MVPAFRSRGEASLDASLEGRKALVDRGEAFPHFGTHFCEAGCERIEGDFFLGHSGIVTAGALVVFRAWSNVNVFDVADCNPAVSREGRRR